jgi:lipopolysaccharide export system ATP-binding protein
MQGADETPLADAWRIDEGIPQQRQRRPAPVNRAQEPRVKPAPQQSIEEIRRLLERTAEAPKNSRIAELPYGGDPGQTPRRAGSPKLLTAGVLAASGLEKSYGGRKVVNDVSLDVTRGEAVGLLGPNGAGKTTVFYMIIGLIKVDAGRIHLDGHEVTNLPMYRRARLGIGYLPQEASIFRGLSVEDNILSVLEIVEPSRERRMERLNALLDEFSLHRVKKSPAIALSGGERRRCEIARALATSPSFMLLDEPFAGIDPIAVGDIQELVRLLKERGIGVLITDHNVRETLGLVDRAYIVHSGSILMEGEPDEIVESREVRRLYLGEEFRL